eukprot:TRINITY_DN14444_c0_g1_i2.p1 TRINITY_DN14444_c0_g1~~TRINITY_DN14444_c0_g1_i2.p1  ORF type:complete len:205 (+),score=32.69 TRINITY_DN14444_c0_g1_i2:96-710(+)
MQPKDDMTTKVSSESSSTDASATECTGCGKPFSLFVWRHYCKACGGAFCSACSSCFVEIAWGGTTKACLGCRDAQLNLSDLSTERGEEASEATSDAEREQEIDRWIQWQSTVPGDMSDFKGRRWADLCFQEPDVAEAVLGCARALACQKVWDNDAEDTLTSLRRINRRTKKQILYDAPGRDQVIHFLSLMSRKRLVALVISSWL